MSNGYFAILERVPKDVELHKKKGHLLSFCVPMRMKLFLFGFEGLCSGWRDGIIVQQSFLPQERRHDLRNSNHEGCM